MLAPPPPCPAGILYETELVPLAVSAALVRLRPAGEGQELAVEQLFGAALRCQPQGDFLQENALLFRRAGALAGRRSCPAVPCSVFSLPGQAAAASHSLSRPLCPCPAPPPHCPPAHTLPFCLPCRRCREMEAYDSDRHCDGSEEGGKAGNGGGGRGNGKGGARQKAAPRKAKAGGARKKAAPRKRPAAALKPKPKAAPAAKKPLGKAAAGKAGAAAKVAGSNSDSDW